MSPDLQFRAQVGAELIRPFYSFSFLIALFIPSFNEPWKNKQTFRSYKVVILTNCYHKTYDVARMSQPNETVANLKSITSYLPIFSAITYDFLFYFNIA